MLGALPIQFFGLRRVGLCDMIFLLKLELMVLYWGYVHWGYFIIDGLTQHWCRQRGICHKTEICCGNIGKDRAGKHDKIGILDAQATPNCLKGN